MLAVAALGWLGWIAWHHANPDVRGELSSYEVVSEHEVRVVIDVERSGLGERRMHRAGPGRLARDRGRPTGDDSCRVGLKMSGSPTVVATEREATAVTVTNCH